MSVQPLEAGPYTGELYGSLMPDDALLTQFADIGIRVRDAEKIAGGVRNAITKLTLQLPEGPRAVAVKSFRRESWHRDRYFMKSGSKARRSFFTAVRLVACGVGTPRPLAYLERWEDNRLVECYYLCDYEESSNFRDELYRLYRDDPVCQKIMTLMKTVATSIADMHDAGVFHRDLGNQNIMIRRVDDQTWDRVQFIDLNRALLVNTLSEKQRARDLSRIDLPSDFLRVFKCMYHRDQHPSELFVTWEDRHRRRFAFHTNSRKYRHPIRALKEKKKPKEHESVPLGADLWVWDDCSVQAVSTMQSRERHTFYPRMNHFYVAKATLGSLLPVHNRYRELLNDSFSREVAFEGRIGVAVGTTPGGYDQESALVEPFAKAPLLFRFYRHAGDAANQATLDEALAYREKGHPVFAALIQDRKAVRDPSVWRAFVREWVPALGNTADWLEVGHAVNRVKWGLWDIRDYRRLLEPVVEAAAPFDRLKLCGPSVIDFEYHYLAGLLDSVKDLAPFDALSSHLYVDRRGAPENKQGAFSSVEKFALAKAYASCSPAVKQAKYMVSEVNWPLLNTGHYSPVCSPYVIPNSHTNDPSVNEEDYANYMIRYYALALCSGHVDAVYWWRMTARGFGLVDDSGDVWRKRPAYAALQTFARLLGRATFREKISSGDGVYAFRFTAQDGDIVLAWKHPGEQAYRPPFLCEAVLSRDGVEQPLNGGSLNLGASPVYFTQVR